MKIRPLNDQVLVLREDEEQKSAGGIIIPDTAKEKPQEGEVVAVGPGKRDEGGRRIPLEVKAGMDAVNLRSEYGRDLCFYGNISARTMAGPREQLEADIAVSEEVLQPFKLGLPAKIKAIVGKYVW